MKQICTIPFVLLTVGFHYVLFICVIYPYYGRPKAIIFLPCSFFLSSIFFFFPSPNLSGHRLDVYHTSTHGVAPSANLECRSEMCCTRLAANTGRKSRQKSPSGYHRTTLSGYIFANKARIDNQKKTC